MQRGIGQLPKPDQFSKVRKNIARIKTVINEMNKADNSASGDSK